MAIKKKKDFLDILIEMIPTLVLTLVIFPILGYMSYQMYTTTILGSSNTVFNYIIFLIIIGINLLVLLGVLYAANLFMTTSMKRYGIIGGIVLAFVIGMTIYRYTLIAGTETGSTEWEEAFENFRFAKEILIGYVAYYVITIFINRIAVLSIKNKKEKVLK